MSAAAGDAGTTVLVPMSEATYARYVESAVAGYAEDSVACGRWPAAGALERSRREFAALLPQGLATPDNHLFEIRDGRTQEPVGAIWFAVVADEGDRAAYVYDMVVEPPHRRRGHALRAFEALEPRVRALGLSRIGLHVFGHNPGAQALYARLGYGVTGINMVKQLDAADGPAA